jgi:hypothetical protein
MFFAILKSTVPELSCEDKHKLLAILQNIYDFVRHLQYFQVFKYLKKPLQNFKCRNLLARTLWALSTKIDLSNELFNILCE